MPAATILITGATGFVGSHVVEALLERNCAVRAVVRPTSNTAHLASLGAEVRHASLHEPDRLRDAMAGVDTVIHLAALTRARDAREYEATNRDGTRAVVQAALTAEPRPRRLVYLSSLAAAGPALPGRPVRREDPPRPLTAYGRSKLAGERECCAAAAEIEVAILRAPAVYGPRDRDVLHFFRLARFGLLPVPTGADRWLQMVHVRDLARAIVQAALRERVHGVFHVAEAQAYTWREICRLVATAVGRDARSVPLPPLLFDAAAAGSQMLGRLTGTPGIFDRDKAREMLAPAWLCETETARAELDFTAEIPLPLGLNETAQWYRAEGLL